MFFLSVLWFKIQSVLPLLLFGASKASSPASSRMGTPSSALRSLLPLPHGHHVVGFFDTELATLRLRPRFFSFAASRVSVGSVPVSTSVLPSKYLRLLHAFGFRQHTRRYAVF